MTARRESRIRRRRRRRPCRFTGAAEKTWCASRLRELRKSGLTPRKSQLEIRNSRSHYPALSFPLRHHVSCPPPRYRPFLPRSLTPRPCRIPFFLSAPLCSFLSIFLVRTLFVPLSPPHIHRSMFLPSSLLFPPSSAASLFILARGERRDDNGKSKGFEGSDRRGRKGEKSREERRGSERETGTGGETREGERVRDEEEDEKSERGIEKDGTRVEARRRDGERGMGGGEMENERPLVQRARPTGSTLLSSLLLSSPLLFSPLLSSPRLASPLTSRGFVTRVSPSAEHLPFSVSLSLSRPVSLGEHDTSYTLRIYRFRNSVSWQRRAMET